MGFTQIDSDGSGHIDTKELCNHLFPQTADYTQKSWYVRSEEKAVQKIRDAAPANRRVSAFVGPKVKGWTLHQLEKMIKEKIMNHTRSDTDRMRMLFQIFNDGGSQSHGIDMDEFYAGLVHRFGLNAPRSLTNKLFTKIDSDGSGHIDTKELCNHLFPQTADYTQKSWYVRSEEKAVQKLETNAAKWRKKSSGEQTNIVPCANFTIPKMEDLMKQKIMQHTRSDEDRVRKLFSMFNDGRGGNHGIDPEEFYRGIVDRFGINIPRTQCDRLFHKLDSDGSGHIDT